MTQLVGRVVLSECSPAIVAQINLVNNFTGTGVVKSFYAPYFCPQCDREKVLLIETRDAVGQRFVNLPFNNFAVVAVWSRHRQRYNCRLRLNAGPVRRCNGTSPMWGVM